MAKKIKVCKKCSGFDVQELAAFVPAREYGVGCVRQCQRRHPELRGKFFGLLNGRLVVCDEKEEFFAAVKKII
jgi:hypothetical protein